MPTSISNSSERRPNKWWRKSWFFVFLLCFVALLSWEMFVRHTGIWRIGTQDSPLIWTEQRLLATHYGNDAIILVGASRIQLGIDTQVMARQTGKKVIQLAIDGNPFMPVLEDLAEDESITGTIIVSASVNGFRRNYNKERRVYDYLKRYHTIANNPLSFDTIESKLNSWLIGYFRSASNFVTPYKYVVWDDDRLEKSGYLVFYSDRSVEADYSIVNVDEMYRSRMKKHTGSDHNIQFREIVDFDHKINEVNGLVSKIRSRGGRVIFVRFPSDKGVWNIDKIRYPKSIYWDRFVKKTEAGTVHFKDFKTLSVFDLPDGSHLDKRDKVAFTEALGSIVFGKN